MSSLNENVQSAIAATVAASSIDALSIIENLTNENARPEGLIKVASTAAEIPAPAPEVATSEQDTSAIASTATGMPDASAVEEAIDDAEKKQEQETVTASTATGIPAPEAIATAVNEAKEEEEVAAKEESKKETIAEQEVTPLSDTLQNAVDSIATAPVAAIQQVIKDISPESNDAPRSAPVVPSEQQSGAEPVKQTENVETSVLSNNAVQAAIASVVSSGAMDVTAYTAAIKEIKVEEPQVEEPKVKEPKVEKPKVEEPKVEEPKVEEPKVEEPKVEEPKVEEPKVEEPKVEEPKVEEPKVEVPKVEEQLVNTDVIKEQEETIAPVIAVCAAKPEEEQEAKLDEVKEQEEPVVEEIKEQEETAAPVVAVCPAKPEEEQEAKVDEVKEQEEPVVEEIKEQEETVAPIIAVCPAKPEEEQETKADEIKEQEEPVVEAIKEQEESAAPFIAVCPSKPEESAVVEEPKMEEQITSTDGVKEQESIAEQVEPVVTEEVKQEAPASVEPVKEIEPVASEQVKHEESVEPIKKQPAPATEDPVAVEQEKAAVVEQVKDEQAPTEPIDVQSTPATSVDTKAEEKPEIVNTVPQTQESQQVPQMESIQKPEPIVPVPLESSEVHSQLPAAASKSLPPQPAQPQAPAPAPVAPASAPIAPQEQSAKPASEAKSSRCTIM